MRKPYGSGQNVRDWIHADDHFVQRHGEYLLSLLAD